VYDERADAGTRALYLVQGPVGSESCRSCNNMSEYFNDLLFTLMIYFLLGINE
jgi:hypothetical protein